MSNFWKSKGFKTRFLASVFLAALVIPSFFLDESGLSIRIILSFGFALSLLEFWTIVLKSPFFPAGKDSLAALSVGLALVVASLGLERIPTNLIFSLIFVVVVTDVFAYLGGNWFGRKFSKSRPFPNVSPKKTWEGVFSGLLLGSLAAIIWHARVLLVRDPSLPVWSLLWVPPAALIGDVLESFFKRRFGVKDSNDYLLDVPVLGWIERLLGGREGHGGYLDRLDSLSFVLFIETILLSLL